MTRPRGRCRRGKRLVAKVPQGHWKTTTVAGLRQDGMTAPFVVDAPMDGEIFLTYLAQCPVPTLAPGEIVTMDNLPAHKVAGVREIIEVIGARLRLLPPRLQSDRTVLRQTQSPFTQGRRAINPRPALSFAVSHHRSAKTISLTPDKRQTNRIPL